MNENKDITTYPQKNRDVRRLSAYHDRDAAPPSFDLLLKEIEDRRNRPSRKWYVVGAGIFLLLAGGFFFIWQSTSLRVVLVPKKITINPEGHIVTIPFEEISLRLSVEGADIPFTVKKVKERARGTIVVYNAYSAKPHRFVARTRFETPDGTIYRVQSPLVVPGGTEKDGAFIPGSIEIEVIADEPGESSNKEFSDFTLPGLKGSVLFDKFYARSKGSISGGRIGEERMVDRDALKGENFADREHSFADQLRANVPQGFLLPEAAWRVHYIMEEKTLYAEITGWMIKRDDLGEKLALLFFESGEAERVVLYDDARLAIANVSSPDDMRKDSLMRIAAEGEVLYAERIVKEEVLGTLANLRSAADVDAFLKNLGSVESATLMFSPAFLKRVPSNPDRITIDISS